MPLLLTEALLCVPNVFCCCWNHRTLLQLSVTLVPVLQWQRAAMHPDTVSAAGGVTGTTKRSHNATSCCFIATVASERFSIGSDNVSVATDRRRHGTLQQRSLMLFLLLLEPRGAPAALLYIVSAGAGATTRSWNAPGRCFCCCRIHRTLQRRSWTLQILPSEPQEDLGMLHVRPRNDQECYR